MKDKRMRFLAIYGFVIIVLLFVILFAPTKLFLSKEAASLLSAKSERKFPDVSTLFSQLDNKEYSYSYNILDSVGTSSVRYACTGFVKKEHEEGTCTEPSAISYTEVDKKEKLKRLHLSLLDISYIYEQIKEKEPIKKEYEGRQILTFRGLVFNTLETDVSIYSDYKTLTQIQITNAYETYVIEFSNIVY